VGDHSEHLIARSDRFAQSIRINFKSCEVIGVKAEDSFVTPHWSQVSAICNQARTSISVILKLSSERRILRLAQSGSAISLSNTQADSSSSETENGTCVLKSN
jgi:hypothetical protein